MTIDPQWDFDALPGMVRSAAENTAAPDVTNALVAQALADSSGDQPALEAPPDPYVTLPGGLYWDGELLRQAEVRELTGSDEEALAAVRGSLAQWMTVLLERAVVRVGDEKPTPKLIRKLLIGDRDELLLGVRIATFGKDVTLHDVVCPHCEQQFDVTVDLNTIDRITLADPQPRHEYQVPLRRGGHAVVRLPDGVAQEVAFSAENLTPAVRNTRLLGECLVEVTDASGKTPSMAGPALAQALGMADRQIVLKYIADHQPGPRLDDVKFTHDACGQEVRLPLELPELFRI